MFGNDIAPETIKFPLAEYPFAQVDQRRQDTWGLFFGFVGCVHQFRGRHFRRRHGCPILLFYHCGSKGILLHHHHDVIGEKGSHKTRREFRGRSVGLRGRKESVHRERRRRCHQGKDGESVEHLGHDVDDEL
eukprot:scaffold2199_cov163-Amphora_coffeaeformis.AAC.4